MLKTNTLIHDKVILYENVFSENPDFSRGELIRKLETIFEVNKIIFIPNYPNDLFGHADGIIRFIDEQTVLINESSDKDSKSEIEFGKSFRSILRKENLNYYEVAYNPFSNITHMQANGTYINYLQMEGFVFVPSYGIKEDETAIKTIEKIFTRKKLNQLTAMKLPITVEY